MPIWFLYLKSNIKFGSGEVLANNKTTITNTK